MRKLFVAMTVFVVAFAFGVGLTAALVTDAQAKPIVCRLTVEPFLYCEEHPSCHGPGEMRCWECLGYDLSGEPCLCARLGCIVP